MKSLLLTVAGIFAFALPVAAQSPANTIDWGSSTFGANKYVVKADGIDSAIVSVTIKNLYYAAMPGLPVQIISSRGDMDEIVPQTPVTNGSGRASFLIRSLRNGTSTLTAVVNGQTFPNKAVTMTFQAGLALSLPVGTLIKIPDDNDVNNLSDTAVYYYASNGKRYVFPNEKTYFTWYPDFSNVRILTVAEMSLIPIGGNVTYRPASKLVKFQTDVKTYLPTKGGILRWVKTEDIARNWYGANWNLNVDDISEAFYVNYKFGEPIGGPYDVSLTILMNEARTVNENLGLGVAQ